MASATGAQRARGAQPGIAGLIEPVQHLDPAEFGQDIGVLMQPRRKGAEPHAARRQPARRHALLERRHARRHACHVFPLGQAAASSSSPRRRPGRPRHDASVADEAGRVGSVVEPELLVGNGEGVEEGVVDHAADGEGRAVQHSHAGMRKG